MKLLSTIETLSAHWQHAIWSGYLSRFFGHWQNIFQAKLAQPLEKLARMPMVPSSSSSLSSATSHWSMHLWFVSDIRCYTPCVKKRCV